MDDDARTIYCGNLTDKVTEEILYELFLQVISIFIYRYYILYSKK